jgi:hypothetical protein
MTASESPGCRAGSDEGVRHGVENTYDAERRRPPGRPLTKHGTTIELTLSTTSSR